MQRSAAHRQRAHYAPWASPRSPSQLASGDQRERTRAQLAVAAATLRYWQRSRANRCGEKRRRLQVQQRHALLLHGLRPDRRYQRAALCSRSTTSAYRAPTRRRPAAAAAPLDPRCPQRMRLRERRRWSASLVASSSSVAPSRASGPVQRRHRTRARRCCASPRSAAAARCAASAAAPSCVACSYARTAARDPSTALLPVATAPRVAPPCRATVSPTAEMCACRARASRVGAFKRQKRSLGSARSVVLASRSRRR